jgi:hypothetical protein
VKPPFLGDAPLRHEPSTGIARPVLWINGHDRFRCAAPPNLRTVARTRYVRPSAVVLGLLLVGSCVGGERATGPDRAELALTIQPALIPSAADGSALPIHRIRAVAARQPDGAVLRELSLDVSPTAPS